MQLDTKEEILRYYKIHYGRTQPLSWIEQVSSEQYNLHQRNGLERLCYTLTGNLELSFGISSNQNTMENKEDLFKKFYNDEKVLISSMSSEDFRIHEESLAQIAFEAKARITAVIDHKREVNASLRLNQKEWLIEHNDAEDQLVSDAINTVASRKKRMNKIEKLNELMKDFMDEDSIKEITRNIERKATDKQVNLISFVKTKETEVKEEIKEAKAEEVKTIEPFDFTKLKF